MRTNNEKVKNILRSVSFILIVLTAVLATVFNAFGHLISSLSWLFLLFLGGFLILFFSVHAISKYFEYDSNGIKVLLLNKSFLLSDHFSYSEFKLEFDKSQLDAFRFKDYFVYKSLAPYITGAKGHTKKEIFNLILVSRKKDDILGSP